jgi:hypothetical protein
MRKLFLAAALALLTACGGPSGALTVDGASKEAAEKSIADMTAALPSDKQGDFKAAIAMGWKLKEIEGKTADDIVAMARTKKIETAEAKLKDLEAAIPIREAAIEKAKKGNIASRRFLQAISLINPQLAWRSATNGEPPSPLISFNMKNGSSEAIQGIVFEVKIGPKAGGKPWIDQRFTFKFAEAVTTDESKFVFVKPDLSQPGNTDALQSQSVSPADYKFVVDFIRVDDVDGHPIMDDEAETKAEADLQAARDAVTTEEAEVKRLQGGGSIAT